MAPPVCCGERVAVVGGGILGLGIALRLANAKQAVTLIEAAPDFGGLAAAWRLGDLVWDRHYHVILASDLRTRALLRAVGLESQIAWSRVGTGFYSDGRFYPMNGALDFFRFPPLGLVDKLRLGAMIAVVARLADPKALECVAVEEWLTRTCGRTTFQKIWRPLLLAKLGDRYRETSAAFIWAIIVRLHAARRAGVGAERFGYVSGGYDRIITTLVAKLQERGAELLPATPVARIARRPDHISIELADGWARSFDRVIVTVPAPKAVELLPELTYDERDRLASKVYGGVVCASLLLDAPLGSYYVTNLTDDRLPFSAVIDMSNVVARSEWGGRAIVYLPKYVRPDDPLFERADAQIEETFLSALEQMYPTFSRRSVQAFRISRVREVFPIATLRYSDRLPALTTSLPGVYVVNSTQIVNGTLNVNETLQLVDRTLDALRTEAGASAVP